MVKRTLTQTEEQWAELADRWWSKWQWCPMPTSAVYRQLASEIPGFVYPENPSWEGRLVRFGVDLHRRWTEKPFMGPFQLRRARHGGDSTYSIWPRGNAFPVAIDYLNRFTEGLTPESYVAVIRAAALLLEQGQLVPAVNTALDPSEPGHIGFELNGEPLRLRVPEPRLIHDATWKTTKQLWADLDRDIALDARRKWKHEDTRRSCRCGCGGEVQPREFLPGHNARHQATLMIKAEMGDHVAAEELLGRGWVTAEQLREWETMRVVRTHKHKLRRS